MLKAAELSALTQPLIERASLAERSRDFRDRAASFVLERLGVAAWTTFEDLPDAQSFDAIAEVRWVDAEVSRFLEQHPCGQGIEIDVGLSTRFHRLSEASDWPRFSWQMVSRPDVDDCLQFVFPRLDNFRTVASETPLDSLPLHATWRGAVPTIIVLGEDNCLDDDSQLQQLYRVVQELQACGLADIRCIVRHRFDSLARALSSVARCASVIDEHLTDARRRPRRWRLWKEKWFKNKRFKGPATRRSGLACIAFA